MRERTHIAYIHVVHVVKVGEHRHIQARKQNVQSCVGPLYIPNLCVQYEKNYGPKYILMQFWVNVYVIHSFEVGEQRHVQARR